MMNREDMAERNLKPQQRVDITSHYQGQTRTVRDYVVVEYPIPRQCTAMYYPEANVLVPINSTEPLSNCPTYKHTVITVQSAMDSASTT